MPKETVDQNPQQGGSYVRKEDGSLDLVQATEPAVPALKTDPAQKDDVQPADDTTSQE